MAKEGETETVRRSGSFRDDPERAVEAGRKGGSLSGGNFQMNPQRAAEAGRKGGQRSGGNFKHDPQRASEAGRKGGGAARNRPLV